MLPIIIFSLLLFSTFVTSSAGPIHDAAMRGNLEKVRELITLKTDVDSVDECGRTALHIAAINGKTEVVNLLLENGANINAATEHGWTPLHWAAAFGYIDIVRILVSNNARIVGHADCITPLQLALISGHLEIVELLKTHVTTPLLPPNFQGNPNRKR